MTQSRTKSGQVYVGSAAADAAGNHGWLLGHFLPEDDARHSEDVEIKWGIHAVATSAGSGSPRTNAPLPSC